MTVLRLASARRGEDEGGGSRGSTSTEHAAKAISKLAADAIPKHAAEAIPKVAAEAVSKVAAEAVSKPNLAAEEDAMDGDHPAKARLAS